MTTISLHSNAMGRNLINMKREHDSVAMYRVFNLHEALITFKIQLSNFSSHHVSLRQECEAKSCLSPANDRKFMFNSKSLTV